MEKVPTEAPSMNDPRRVVTFLEVRDWVWNRVITAVADDFGVTPRNIMRCPMKSLPRIFTARVQAANIVIKCVRRRSAGGRKHVYNVMESGQPPFLPMAVFSVRAGRSLWTRISEADMGAIFLVAASCISCSTRLHNKKHGTTSISFSEYIKSLGCHEKGS